MKRKRIIFIIAAVLILAFVGFRLIKKDKSQISIETEVVSPGSISNIITATGTVEPIEKVEVGTQVSGIIEKIYVDFNTVVKEGELLAELDKLTLSARLAQARASLESAENEMNYQEQNYNRIKILYEDGSVSQTEYETSEYKYRSARASYNRLQSELDQARVNLSYADITSPISGTVISKNVEEGQTVAASLNTPTLFYIARDLNRMQVEADIDEADIGKVQEGQKVEFTVDAYPDDLFIGEVSQKRLEAKVISNVVTYTVIIEALNPDLKLMPGMTASISIITENVEDVLTVPAAATKFTPTEELAGSYEIRKFEIPAENREMMGKRKEMMEKRKQMIGSGQLDPEQMKPPGNRSPGFGGDMQKPTIIWVKSGDVIEPRPVRIGMTDGTTMEVKRGLKAGDTVIVSVKTMEAEETTSTQKSPFMPQMPGRRKR